jgi:hypothetical protein
MKLVRKRMGSVGWLKVGDERVRIDWDCCDVGEHEEEEQCALHDN